MPPIIVARLLRFFKRFDISRGSLQNAMISAGYFSIAILPLYIYTDRPLSGMTPLYIALGIVVLGSWCAWLMAYQRSRLVADTPTTRVSNAPQGYVELMGWGDLCPGGSVLDFGPLRHCLWYRVKISAWAMGRSQRSISYERRDQNFVLVDDSGQCIIDPVNAEVVSTHKQTWYTGNWFTTGLRRYQARYLVHGDTLYALGAFETQSYGVDLARRNADIAAKLRAWKADKHELLRRFDVAGDGNISTQEWAVARKVAGDEVDAEYREMHQTPPIHIMRAPLDGRPFLLANRDPRRLMQRYRYWAWFHMLVFICSATYGIIELGNI